MFVKTVRMTVHHSSLQFWWSNCTQPLNSGHSSTMSYTTWAENGVKCQCSITTLSMCLYASIRKMELSALKCWMKTNMAYAKAVYTIRFHWICNSTEKNKFQYSYRSYVCASVSICIVCNLSKFPEATGVANHIDNVVEEKGLCISVHLHGQSESQLLNAFAKLLYCSP